MILIKFFLTIEEFFHSNLDHTMSIYAHFFDKHDKKIVDNLDDIHWA